MPTGPLRPCATPRCTALVRRGHCPQHAQQRERERPLWESRKLYRTARWAAMRRQQLQARPLCHACEARGRVTPAEHVDHRTPHRGDLTLFWDADNLDSLCAACHGAKTRSGL